MAVETKADLNKSTIEGLQELIQMNIDSSQGFEHVADRVKLDALRIAFHEISEERQRQADELSAYVAVNHETPNRKGSFAAALHRSWISCLEYFSANDLHALMAEAERGEDMIKEAYEKVLRETAGSAVNDILTRHYSRVKLFHDKIRDLRDVLAKKS